MFQKVFLTVCMGSGYVPINPFTDYYSLGKKAYGLKNNYDGSNLSSGSSKKFLIKAIQQVELAPFSGKTEKFIEWYESTECHFSVTAAEPLLKDVALCNEHIDI